MEGFAIGAGLGLVGILTIVIVGYILNYRLVNDRNTERDDRRQAEISAKNEDEKNRVLESNVIALRSENNALKSRNDLLTAQLGAVERTADDLRNAIETSQPSALPVAVRAELDRLREKASVSATAAAAPTGDSDRRQGDPVHETDGSKDHPG